MIIYIEIYNYVVFDRVTISKRTYKLSRCRATYNVSVTEVKNSYLDTNMYALVIYYNYTHSHIHIYLAGFMKICHGGTRA